MTLDQQKHLEKSKGKVRIAREMVDRRPVDPAALDNAAHNAYYAMIHIAQAFLEEHVAPKASHGQIIGEFGRIYVKPGVVQKSYGKNLNDGQSTRNIGDYNEASNVTLQAAQEIVLQAEAFVALCETSLDGLYIKP